MSYTEFLEGLATCLRPLFHTAGQLRGLHYEGARGKGSDWCFRCLPKQGHHGESDGGAFQGEILRGLPDGSGGGVPYNVPIDVDK